ncbi:MAG: hypothetical protein KDJ19_00055 [Hyphomicrobiaceae bacterium]|nr:hypothetical protein [Hyphomicrobiaceae bacterium]MCC0023795.1 hypothetical protein [Hyphomicrobiaceae bacterium]
MKIKSIKAFALPAAHASPYAQSQANRESWVAHTEVANPMSRYPRFKAHRDSWRSDWAGVGCIVTADDDSQGYGSTIFAGPVLPIINDHLAPLLIGEDAGDISGLWEMMMRIISPYGGAGLSCYAVSAVDLALWDLKARRENVPVYQLAGSMQRDAITCYATGNDTDWHRELGFTATKLACPHGPADGEVGLQANVDLVARTRDLIGPGIKLMLDCWMAFDVDYAVELSKRLEPYNVGWIEDCLIPEDIEAHHELRRRLPDRVLASGEHWYGTHMFEHAAKHRLVDYFQPDICWVGGLTPTLRIAEIAEHAGIQIIPHAGMNSAYGQHFNLIAGNAPMGEMFVGSPPGVPLEQAITDKPVPQNGVLVPSDAPGFGPWPDVVLNQ